MAAICGETGCGQWVMDLLDYFLMKYSTPLFLYFYSLIPTFLSIFYFLSLTLLFWVYFSKLESEISMGDSDLSFTLLWDIKQEESN